MNAIAAKLMPLPLRVAIFASEPRRLALLSQWVRDFGHIVVTASQDPAIVLTDGVAAAAGNVPTVALGMDSETYQARLPGDASPEQIDAALRAVAAGLSVTIADESARGFEAAQGFEALQGSEADHEEVRPEASWCNCREARSEAALIKAPASPARPCPCP